MRPSYSDFHTSRYRISLKYDATVTRPLASIIS